MGMDVYGKNQESEKGAYFRNNVWWWRPLWNYCEELHGDITHKVESGYSNDGDGLDAENALALGQRLLNDLATGVTASPHSPLRNANTVKVRVSVRILSALRTVCPKRNYLKRTQSFLDAHTAGVTPVVDTARCNTSQRTIRSL